VERDRVVRRVQLLLFNLLKEQRCCVLVCYLDCVFYSSSVELPVSTESNIAQATLPDHIGSRQQQPANMEASAPSTSAEAVPSTSAPSTSAPKPVVVLVIGACGGGGE